MLYVTSIDRWLSSADHARASESPCDLVGGGDGALAKASKGSRGKGKKAEPEVACVTKAQHDALMAHYERYFGEPSHFMIGERISADVKVDIYLFPPTDERPFITAATVGMSALPLKEHPLCEKCAAKKNTGKHRSELLMYLDPNWDFGDLICRYPLLMMTYIAREPHLRKNSFGPGLTYEFPLEMVPEGSLLTNGLIIRPALEVLDGDFEKFASVQLPDEPPCDLYWMIPITTAECYVKRTQGRDALLDLLLDNEYFCLDIDRQCYVEPENRHQRRAREKAQRTRAKRRPDTSVYELTCEACGHGHDG